MPAGPAAAEASPNGVAMEICAPASSLLVTWHAAGLTFFSCLSSHLPCSPWHSNFSFHDVLQAKPPWSQLYSRQ